MLQVLKACALVSQQAELLLWLRRLQAQLATRSQDYISLCSQRVQQQQASGPGRPSKTKVLPSAAQPNSIRSWYKQPQAQAAGAAEVPACSSTHSNMTDTDSSSILDSTVAHMKFFLLNAPLAARVCLASSNSQVCEAHDSTVRVATSHPCICSTCFQSG